MVRCFTLNNKENLTLIFCSTSCSRIIYYNICPYRISILVFQFASAIKDSNFSGNLV